jgi:hypothetical protein
MLADLQTKHDWVVDLIEYSSIDRPVETMDAKITRAAEAQYDGSAWTSGDCWLRVLKGRFVPRQGCRPTPLCVFSLR